MTRINRGMTTRTMALLFGAMICLFALGAARADSPASHLNLPYPTSPNSRYDLKYYNSDKNGGSVRVVLVDHVAKRRILLYEDWPPPFTLWSPDSRRISMNFIYPDFAECFLVRLPQVSFTSLNDRIFRFIDGPRLLGGDSDHLVFECEKWISAGTLVVRAWADHFKDEKIPGDESHNFDARVAYSVTGHMKLLSLKRDLPMEQLGAPDR